MLLFVPRLSPRALIQYLLESPRGGQGPARPLGVLSNIGRCQMFRPMC